MNELKLIENRVMASNCVGYLSPMAAMHCKKYNGQDIANMYQRIGYTDPLILKAPNPLAYCTFNLYPVRENLRSQCSPVMSDPRKYFDTALNQPYYTHYGSQLRDNQHPEVYKDVHDKLIKQNTDIHGKCKDDFDYQLKLINVLKSVATGYNDPETGIAYEASLKG